MDIFKLLIPLVIFLTQRVFSTMPLVADVRLICKNRHNVLHWTYSQPSEQAVRFRVDLRSTYSPPTELWAESPEHHCDISSSTENLIDDYSVTVTAVIGQNQSEPAPPDPILFSYDRDAVADQYCFLDMPTVNMSVQSDHSISLDFLHPFFLYGEDKMEASTTDNNDYDLMEEFIFKVTTGDQRELSGDSCEERVCHAVVPLDQQEKKNHCVTVQGWMKSHLIGPQEFCILVQKHNDHRGLVVALCMASAGLLVLAGVGVMFYYKKTRGSYPRLPSFMISKVNDMVRKPHRPDSTGVLLAQTPSPGSTPLLCPQEEEVGTVHGVPSPTCPELRLPYGVQVENISPVVVLTSSNQSGSSCGGGSVEEAGQGDGFGRGAGMDEEEEEEEEETEDSATGYDHTHGVFAFEMAPEDVVEGYREAH